MMVLVQLALLQLVFIPQYMDVNGPSQILFKAVIDSGSNMVGFDGEDVVELKVTSTVVFFFRFGMNSSSPEEEVHDVFPPSFSIVVSNVVFDNDDDLRGGSWLPS